MQVELWIPFRDDNLHSRESAYRATRNRVSNAYPFANVSAVDTDHLLFNRSAARNRAVVLAEERGADVVVLCDADSIPQPAALKRAIDSAAASDSLFIPHRVVWQLTPKATRRLLAGYTPMENRAWHVYGPSEGGCWVFRPSAWWRAGGQEERFVGWGCEDEAMIASGRTFVGNAVLLDGVLWNLHHDRETCNERDLVDIPLRDRYNRAQGKRNQMLDIIAEREDGSEIRVISYNQRRR